jgi:hemerythrin-like domain-containing protein
VKSNRVKYELNRGMHEETQAYSASRKEKKMHNEFFQILKKDHQEVRGILGQLKESKETALKKREELFQKLREELVPHMKAEEKTFYQPLMATKEAREDAMEGMEEHHVAEMVFKELQKMPMGEEQWGAKLSVFKELVEHHLQEEERKVFKSAEKALGRDEIQNIMKQFEKEKQKIKKDNLKSAA